MACHSILKDLAIGTGTEVGACDEGLAGSVQGHSTEVAVTHRARSWCRVLVWPQRSGLAAGVDPEPPARQWEVRSREGLRRPVSANESIRGANPVTSTGVCAGCWLPKGERCWGLKARHREPQASPPRGWCWQPLLCFLASPHLYLPQLGQPLVG